MLRFRTSGQNERPFATARGGRMTTMRRHSDWCALCAKCTLSPLILSSTEIRLTSGVQPDQIVRNYAPACILFELASLSLSLSPADVLRPGIVGVRGSMVIRLVSQIIFRENSEIHEVTVRTHYYCRCGAIHRLQIMKDSSTNIVAAMAKGLPQLDGKDQRAYRDWEARVKVNFNESPPSRQHILTGQETYNPIVGSNLIQIGCAATPTS